MRPILYHASVSPFSRAVEIVIKLLNLDIELKSINLFKGEQKTEEYAKINPRQKIPYLVDDDLQIGESRAITTYLIDKYAKDDSLYPKNLATRAKINELLYFDASALAPAGIRVLIPVLMGGEMNKSAEPDYIAALTHLENLAKDRKFFIGDKYTVADISLASSLEFPGAVGYSLAGYPNLVAYLQSVRKAIPHYLEVTSPALEGLKSFLDNRNL